MKHVTRLQIIVVGLPRRGRLAERTLDLGLVHMGGEDRHDGTCDLVLNREHVLDLPVVALGPAWAPVMASTSCTEIRTRSPLTANASLQHVAHAKFAADLPHVHNLALVLERGVAGDDE